MPSNIELKMKVPVLTAVRALIRELKAADKPDCIMTQTDTFFRGASGRLKLRVENGQKCGTLIQYDRNDTADTKLSDYVKTDVPDAELMKEALRRAYGILGIVEKTRELWMIGHTRVHIDEVEGLGSFVEFEVMVQNGQTLAQAEEIAYGLLERLELSNAERISGAYMDLILKNAL